MIKCRIGDLLSFSESSSDSAYLLPAEHSWYDYYTVNALSMPLFILSLSTHRLISVVIKFLYKIL